MLTTLTWLSWNPPSIAQDPQTALIPVEAAAIARELSNVLLPDRTPLNVDLLDIPADELSPNVIRRDTISQTQLTDPSLWWGADRFGEKLLETWLAYPQQKRIDLVVNAQFWGLLDYLERYEFINHMGAIARSSHYNLRVFDRQQPDLVLGAYTCIFQAEPIICRVDLERNGSSGFRGSGL